MLRLAILAAVTCISANVAFADVIKLSNGGELRGKLVSQPKDTSKPIVIQTLSGAVVTIDQDTIEFVTKRRLIVEAYETRKKFVPNTEAGHWEMAEWCRSNNLRKQRETHLERVIFFNPDHEQARYGLKHTKRNGKWMSPAEKDAEMRAKGYAKYKGRYITEEELQLLEQTEIEIAAERQWFQKIKPLHKRLVGRDADRSKAAHDDFKKIDSPHAVPALKNFCSEDKNNNVRRLYVEILSQVEGVKPVEALVEACLLDSDAIVREIAVKGFKQDQLKTAKAFFVDGLQNKYNVVVNRAAAMLEEIGSEDVIPNLIDALTSTHRYQVKRPATNNSYSFTTDGNFAGNQSPIPPEIELMLISGQLPQGVIVLNSGQPPVPMKTVTVRYTHKNPQVRSALKKLTGQDFGYDSRSWRLWLAADSKKIGNAPVLN